MSSGAFGFIKIRRYLLSHLQYYHRLGKLNYRVRDGNGCDLYDMFAGRSPAGGKTRRACSVCDNRWCWLWAWTKRLLAGALLRLSII